MSPLPAIVKRSHMIPEPNDSLEHVTGPYPCPPLFGWSTAGWPWGATVVGELWQLRSTVFGLAALAGVLLGVAARHPNTHYQRTAATATPANPIRRLTNTSCFE